MNRDNPHSSIRKDRYSSCRSLWNRNSLWSRRWSRWVPRLQTLSKQSWQETLCWVWFSPVLFNTSGAWSTHSKSWTWLSSTEFSCPITYKSFSLKWPKPATLTSTIPRNFIPMRSNSRRRQHFQTRLKQLGLRAVISFYKSGHSSCSSFCFRRGYSSKPACAGSVRETTIDVSSLPSSSGQSPTLRKFSCSCYSSLASSSASLSASVSLSWAMRDYRQHGKLCRQSCPTFSP